MVVASKFEFIDCEDYTVCFSMISTIVIDIISTFKYLTLTARKLTQNHFCGRRTEAPTRSSSPLISSGGILRSQPAGAFADWA